MTQTPNNGGPAFPTLGDAPMMGQGMSLRDYFAGQALSNMGIGGKPVDVAWFQQCGAKHAYQIADAMIAARGAQ